MHDGWLELLEFAVRSVRRLDRAPSGSCVLLLDYSDDEYSSHCNDVPFLFFRAFWVVVWMVHRLAIRLSFLHDIRWDCGGRFDIRFVVPRSADQLTDGKLRDREICP